ncbi:MAG: contractile injection system tape measure protein [Synechococcus sp.]
MAPDNTHQILRQVLALELNRTEGAIELQSAVAQVFRDRGQRVMETLFDRLVGPDELIRLERVEIDLGELRGSDWPEQFSRRLAEQLEEKLTQALETQDLTSQHSSSRGSTRDGLFQQFLFFCQYGRLPWESRKPSRESLETLPSTMTRAQYRSLASLLRQDSRALRRSIYTVSDEFLQTIPQRLCELASSARVRMLLMPEGLSRQSQSLWREQFWVIVLESTIPASAISFAGSTAQLTATWQGGPKLVRRLLAERQKSINAAGINAPETGACHPANGCVDGSGRSLQLPQPWQSWLESVPQYINPLQHSQTTVVPPELEAPIDGTSYEACDRDSDDPPIQQPATPAKSTTQDDGSPHSSTHKEGWVRQRAIDTPSEPLVVDLRSSDRSSTEPGKNLLESREALVQMNAVLPFKATVSLDEDLIESLYIEGAGAVIVHPFLQELFGSLDLLSNLQFRDQQAQRSAVALTTYLTYGDLDVLEYDLLLPKLLCSWLWEEPLPPYELDESECKAAAELLGAVLKHWSALRSSSADWLRQQFFWRDGKLTRVDFGWKLEIERRAQDVLLDKLPWSIGVIRLPWMSDFLHVSWTS